MRLGPTTSTDPMTPLINNSDTDYVSRRVRRCYKLAKLGMWFTLIATATISLYTRVGGCMNLSNEQCKNENEYLAPTELSGLVAGSVLVFEKIIVNCSLDNLCNEQNSNV